MQRKPGFPVANCNIKVPDGSIQHDTSFFEDDTEQQKKRLQLVNFGHTQWGFNNWSWSVIKQDLDFVDFTNGKYVAGVVAFVSIKLKTLEIHRENIGYATANAPMKGSAIYQARKGAVTNALRETLLSFGGNVATELTELLEANRPEVKTVANAPTPTPQLPEPIPENNQNVPTKPLNEPKNMKKEVVNAIRSPHPNQMNAPVNQAMKSIPPVVKAPVPANQFPANQPPRPVPPRPNSNDTQKAIPSFEGMTDEEARAERKRRQKQAQEEFRLKQLTTKTPSNDGDKEKVELHKSSFDQLLMDIPTQDIVIEETGNTVVDGKRRSPETGGNAAKRRAGVFRKLDIFTD